MGLKRTVRDCVYGMAVGDALGVPFEFKPRDSFECADMVGYGTHNQPAGTWSDDTSMALALCDSYRVLGHIDCDDICERFRAWINTGAYTADGNVFDYGGATARALRMGRGCTEENSKGNGSLMRCLPMVFMGCSSSDIREVSAITHATEDCMKACEQMIAYGRKVLYAGAAGHESGQEPGGSSGYVWDTYSAAIWCLEHTSNYRDCVLAAVNLGDDTDTTACVAGGLAGILYGYEGIPVEWLETLRGKDVIDSCLFSADYATTLKAFCKRFEAALVGSMQGFHELDGDMFALGFNMDCGEEFLQRYPEGNTLEGLRAVIAEIDDAPLLGSGIFSHWRYVTHWTWEGEPSEEDLEWFRLAVKRLEELA